MATTAYGDQSSVTRNYVAGQANDTTSVATSYTFDAAGDVLTETDPIEAATPTTAAVTRTTTSTYDLFGNVLTELVPGDSSVPSQKTIDTYDEFGNLIHQGIYSPDTSGTPLSSTTTSYDPCDRSTSVASTTSSGTTTSATAYDAAGDALTTVDDDGTVTANIYDGLGQLLSEQPSGQDATNHVYDGLGDETSTLAPTPAMGATTTSSGASISTAS